MDCVAIIPARGGSVRVPRKNIIDICGYPALHYPLQTCLKSGLFDAVIVSTDDDEIAEIAAAAGAEVMIRSAALSDSVARVRDVTVHTWQELKNRDGRAPSLGCIVYPTAIFLKIGDLEKSHQMMVDRGEIDFVMAVARMPIHPFKGLATDDAGILHPIFPDKIDLKGQEHGEAVAPCGAFHWFRKDAMLDPKQTFWQQKRAGYVVDDYASIDIDQMADVDMVRALMQAQIAHSPCDGV